MSHVHVDVVAYIYPSSVLSYLALWSAHWL